QLARQPARVDVVDGEHAVGLEIVVQPGGRAEVARDPGKLAGHEPLDPHLARLPVFFVDPVIPDVRVGHRDDLPLVGRIRQDLLLARHRGIEDDLAGPLPVRAEGAAREHRPVLERQSRYLHLSCSPSINFPLLSTGPTMIVVRFSRSRYFRATRRTSSRVTAPTSRYYFPA